MGDFQHVAFLATAPEATEDLPQKSSYKQTEQENS